MTADIAGHNRDFRMIARLDRQLKVRERIEAFREISKGALEARRDLAAAQGQQDVVVVAFCVKPVIDAANKGIEYAPLRLGGAQRGADGQFVITPNP